MMCLGFPGKIIELDDMVAKVDIAGTHRDVSIMILPEDVELGDWVMVHAGMAIAKMDPDEAQKTLQVLKEFADGLDD
jgi:hydrogenase expression/formation protein HypC